MTDPLLDHLRATAHDTAPEPGPALDPGLVLAHGRRRRRARYTVGAVAGLAAFATAVAVGAPLLDRADATVDPASAPSGTATVEPAETAEPTTAETSAPASAEVPATPPEPVDVGLGTIAVVGPGADGYLGAPGGVKVWLSSTDGPDFIDLRLEFPNGYVFQSTPTTEPLEKRSREFYHWSYKVKSSPDDEEGIENGPEYPFVVVGHLGEGGGDAPRAAVVTSGSTAAELPLFQVPGSDRWFYVFWEGEDTQVPEGVRRRVVVRQPDGTYEIGSCGDLYPERSCGPDTGEEWMVDLAREILE